MTITFIMSLLCTFSPAMADTLLDDAPSLYESTTPDFPNIESVVTISRTSQSSNIFRIVGTEVDKRAELINNKKIYFKKLDGTITASATYKKDVLGDKIVTLHDLEGQPEMRITEKSALGHDTYFIIEVLGKNRRTVSVGQKISKNQIDFFRADQEDAVDPISTSLFTPGNSNLHRKPKLNLFIVGTPPMNVRALMALSIFTYYRGSELKWFTSRLTFRNIATATALLAAAWYKFKYKPPVENGADPFTQSPSDEQVGSEISIPQSDFSSSNENPADDNSYEFSWDMP